MTTTAPVRGTGTPPPPPGWVRQTVTPAVVLLATLAVVVGRLPFINSWLGKDESGFLYVAQQWHPGSSLYGNYWVDRPPLLITIFRAAALMGGTVPLRLIGIGAAVITVLAVAQAAQSLAGPRAAIGAAITAAAFLISHRTGAAAVNGELLATAFIAIGIAGSLAMLTTSSTRRALAASVLAGAAGLLAVLVKQNMLDVFIFTGVLVVLRVRSVGVTRLATVLGGFLGGATVAGGVMAIWTLAHGTSLSGVWFAMYRFRIEANTVMAAEPSAAATLRGLSLLRDTVLSGMILVVALLLACIVRARRDHPAADPASSVARAVPLALAVTLAYDATSIYLGKSYWSHYLVQIVVPLALSAGLSLAHRARTSGLVIAVLATVAVWTTFTLAHQPDSPGGNRLGAEIAAVSRPGDTIVTVWGQADVTHASGLSSPYPYLWSLPARTLDPRAELLTATLAGPHAPTWFVAWTGTGLPGVDTSALKAELRQDYHRVARRHGHTVYLHNGVRRPAPTTLTTP